MSVATIRLMVMGQVALGFRSLLTKAVIFFVMAALLAWALGGTLWPRAHVVDGLAVEVDGERWWWQMKVGGGLLEPKWSMMVRPQGGTPAKLNPTQTYLEVSGPVVWNDLVAFAGRTSGGWHVYIVELDGMATMPMPDRLAVEQQLSRFEAGLPVQDQQTILRQRRIVLNPADDENEG